MKNQPITTLRPEVLISFTDLGVTVHASQPYRSTDSTVERKRRVLSLLDRSDFQILSILLQALHAAALRELMSLAELDIKDGPFEQGEYEKAKKSLVEGKASGEDGIPPEVLKRCGGLDRIILDFCNRVLTRGEKPEQWSLLNIVPISKSGDLRLGSNYRGIGLSSLVAKILNKMLLNRIRPAVDGLLRCNQNGFREGRSTVGHVLALRRLIEGIKSHNLPAIITFIDFKKAFDTIHRGKMLSILKAYGIPELIVHAIGSLYEGTMAKVVTQDGDTRPFEIQAGVLQEDTLAPYLFVLVLEYALRVAIEGREEELGFQLVKRRSRRIGPKVVTDLDFADDIALLSEEVRQAQQLLRNVETSVTRVGLQMNAGKTKFMAFNQQSPFGGIPGRSTAHCLVSILHQLSLTPDRRGTVSSVVLTDFSKAFDRVDHTTAITRLLYLGCRASLLPWICYFLSGRKQRVVYQNAYSEWKELTSGLPQGTVLAPIIFIALINNATKDSRANNWKSVDDLTLIERGLLREPLHPQEDLNGLHRWTTEPRLHAHHSTSTGKPFRSFVLPNCWKYLLTVYTCYVRPLLEYAAPVWSPGLTRTQTMAVSIRNHPNRDSGNSHSSHLVHMPHTPVKPVSRPNADVVPPEATRHKRLQRRACRTILGTQYTCYSEACALLNLPTLESRREQLSWNDLSPRWWEPSKDLVNFRVICSRLEASVTGHGESLAASSMSVKNRMGTRRVPCATPHVNVSQFESDWRCLPYFYIIGMPKCGTTDLYNRISKHPDVAPGRKEPHWWAKSKDHILADYLTIFDKAAWTIENRTRKSLTSSGQEIINHNVITVDGSPSTIWGNRHWRSQQWGTPNNEPPILLANLMQAVQPHAKFILTLRNPTDR
ncbi:hypothetical protein Bbelb_024980 [Branchiostoma belcheri]|nr:hypothetical protein Bbelb_024980 [Branchiostoma belcheri]